MKLPASLTLALVLGAASLAANATTVIDFDDLPSSIGDPLPEGYADLSWDNFFFLEAANFGPSGYQTGTVSPPNVGFNAYGSPASFYSATPFTL
ncbi:MAG: hypothetical protein ACLGI6_01285, partial [Gammaproteobacteria bacterium]